jgi:hypothetical protein
LAADELDEAAVGGVRYLICPECDGVWPMAVVHLTYPDRDTDEERRDA